MTNQSTADLVWSEGGKTYTELIRQAYSNCVFSAGTVEGHPVDTLYLKLERDGTIDTFLLLRPDEAAAVAWCLTGALWSDALRHLIIERKDSTSS
jgi:hypothetical protein